jgi:hypothetical protein
MYLLQLPSFIFATLGLRCCIRMKRGGGAGNRVPYRIFIEGGGVLLFVLALAPAAPIVAPMAVLYFIICNPILRYTLLFAYKPVYDAGAIRFPFLFEMCISSLVVSQILLATMILLKGAIGPAILAGLLIIPTLVYRRTAIRKFLRAYQDAALLQTSLLDGWDAPEDSYSRSLEGREEFRQFLVDCHKAAYVPACIAGTNTGRHDGAEEMQIRHPRLCYTMPHSLYTSIDKILTSEPAVVVPVPTDKDDENLVLYRSDLPPIPIARALTKITSEARSPRHESYGKCPQIGALLRRNGTGPVGPLVHPNIPNTPSRSRDDPIQSASIGNQLVKLSSLGWVHEGPSGEMYLAASKESQKDL